MRQAKSEESLLNSNYFISNYLIKTIIFLLNVRISYDLWRFGKVIR